MFFENPNYSVLENGVIVNGDNHIKIYYVGEKDHEPGDDHKFAAESFLNEYLKSNKCGSGYGFAIIDQSGSINLGYWDNHVLMSRLWDSYGANELDLDKNPYLDQNSFPIIMGETRLWFDCFTDDMRMIPCEIYMRNDARKAQIYDWPVEKLDVDLDKIDTGNIFPDSFEVYSMSKKGESPKLEDFVGHVGRIETLPGEERLFAIYYPHSKSLNIYYEIGEQIVNRIFDVSTSTPQKIHIEEYGPLCCKEAAIIMHALGMYDMKFD